MAITELVIDRAKWGKSALLNPDGTMCCLGFLSKACGVEDVQMLGVSYPKYEWIKSNGLNKEFAANTGDQLSRAAQINDSTDMPIADKEIQLTALFAKNGIALSFTGDHRSE